MRGVEFDALCTGTMSRYTGSHPRPDTKRSKGVVSTMWCQKLLIVLNEDMIVWSVKDSFDRNIVFVQDIYPIWGVPRASTSGWISPLRVDTILRFLKKCKLSYTMASKKKRVLRLLG